MLAWLAYAPLTPLLVLEPSAWIHLLNRYESRSAIRSWERSSQKRAETTEAKGRAPAPQVREDKRREEQRRDATEEMSLKRCEARNRRDWFPRIASSHLESDVSFRCSFHSGLPARGHG